MVAMNPSLQQPLKESANINSAATGAKGLIALVRPHHWIKNSFCFAGVVFSGQVRDLRAVEEALLTAVVFGLASSAMYVVNDIVDVERDKLHPIKKSRPMATGVVSKLTALLLAVAFLLPALALATRLGTATFMCMTSYLLLNIVYTHWLKHLPILDVVCIAMGFVLRLLAGIYAVQELPTAWITLCTFFLAIFLAIAKRRAEFTGESAEGFTRPVLRAYSLPFIDMLLSGSGNIAVITYALFTTAGGKNPNLVLTVPIVYFAISHYKRLTLVEGRGQEPERILLKDRTLQASILAWLLIYAWILYTPVHLFR
jgi:4-hydroxybenzoate polyprenyltransferase